MTVQIFISFFTRIWPGLVVLGASFVFLKPSKDLRVLLYLLAFVLFRDVMTPLGLWDFGSNSGVFWIRLSDDLWFLTLFGLSALGLTLAAYFMDKDNQSRWEWGSDSPILGGVFGICGAFVVVAPLFLAYSVQPMSIRGGAVAGELVFPILVFALLGNFMEEGLFRGYVLGILRDGRSDLHAGVLSGLVFSLCHVPLAITVSDAGWPLLLFTLWEGAIAGIVGAKHGVIPATLTHGGAIFLLSSGLV